MDVLQTQPVVSWMQTNDPEVENKPKKTPTAKTPIRKGALSWALRTDGAEGCEVQRDNFATHRRA